MTPLSRSLAFAALLTCAAAAPEAAAQAEAAAERPLEGDAYQLADQAYKQYDAGHYETAEIMAENAIRLRPDVARLRLLLVYALEKQGKRQEAARAADAAIADGLGTAELRRALANLRRPPATASAPPPPAAQPSPPAPQAAPTPAPKSAYQRAYPVAARAYADYARHDYAAAAAGAERAFRAAPAQGEWALLWVESLGAQHQYEAARRAVDSALALGAPNKAALLSRQQAFQRQTAAARAAAAPAAGGEAAASAYAAYDKGEFQEAIAQARLAVAQAPDNESYAQLLTTTLAAGNPAQAAEAEARLDDEIARQPGSAQRLAQRGYVRQRLGRPDEAAADFAAARATGQAPPRLILDQAYAQSAMGDNRAATASLKQAIDQDDAGQLGLSPLERYNTRSAIANLSREWGASFSASYRGARPASSSLGGAAINTPGDVVFSTAEIFWRPPQLNNRWGMLEAYARSSNTLHDSGSTYESRKNVDPCTGLSTPDERDDEERFRNNRSASGIPSTIGALGLRYLLADTGVTFGIERRFYLGSGTRQGYAYPESSAVQCNAQRAFHEAYPNLQDQSAVARYKLNGNAGGWMTYITYGYYQGRELRVDVPSWLTIEGYAQAGYAWDDNSARYTAYSVDAKGDRQQELGSASGRLKRDQAFLSGELRVGRSFRATGISDKLVLFPYAVVGADWLWQKNVAKLNDLPVYGNQSVVLSSHDSSWSLGVGPGFNVRYWFREDHYNAPRSYLDLGVQYRTSIGGGATDRAKGWFMNMTLSY
ncbi:MAG: NfrA family protein [Achromobacter sp.]|uniref:NfrA family protein n=1 Tax=Achromobacter sp. TaxID=134375 RepID=UPI003D08F586